MTQNNPLLRTDVYKMGHMLQYAPGTSKVYSYLCARSSREYSECVWFGLQYFLKQYLTQPITQANVQEFIHAYGSILGQKSQETEEKLIQLARLGYWPIKIKALPEGTIVPVRNALMTITNTLPHYGWAVGFLESLLLKVQYPTRVATNSLQYRKTIEAACIKTGCSGGEDFLVHDFGYRSDDSEEGAGISGAAHLIAFRGSDTVPAWPFLREYYGETGDPMISVPASEHSVMCSYGVDNEMQAFERMLELYPSGFVSIVSDTYDIYHVCTEILPALKQRILARNGKVVIRPDSGNPPNIICGDPNAPIGSPAFKGVLQLLAEEFGYSTNASGYKVLNEKVGLIYGDGMYHQRYIDTLARMEKMGFAAANLVIGIGGILRSGTRDTLGMAIKATHVIVDGAPRDILKSPITDPGKKSHTGLFHVYRNTSGVLCTNDKATPAEEENSLLQTVFEDGRVVKEFTFDEVRENFRECQSLVST
ncbi:MAG: nicotinate phosphoribosyltransferase [Planctomycetaceae bacterium]